MNGVVRQARTEKGNQTIMKNATKKTTKPAAGQPEAELGNPQGVTLVGAGTKAATKATKPAAKKPAAKAKAKPAKATKRAKTAAKAKPAAAGKATNKKAQVIAMMSRPQGASLAEIMKATDWQRHTVRGFMSILGSKGGQQIESTNDEKNGRTYRIA
jgi:uncharacterized iron-regulated membrane protein